MSTLSSERLIFRILGPEDVSERYLTWLNDPEVNQYLETRYVEQTRELCEQFVADMAKDPGSYLFGIFEKNEMKHIGNIKLGFVDSYHQRAQLSLFLGEKSCWGQGYGTEAVRCLSNWGFDSLGLERIEAGCYEVNMASLRTFLKVGYSVEGYFRKKVLFNGRRIGSFWLGMLKGDSIE